MEYFYIAGTVASIVAFFAYIYDRYIELKETGSFNLAHKWLALFIVLLLTFWAWFYICPDNIPRKIISGRSVLVESYSNGKENIDIVQGELELDMARWRTTISLPPFVEAPKITLVPHGGTGMDGEPVIYLVTPDKFSVKISSSTLAGKWSWRARGKLLRRITNEASNK
jgi:hypothetical protein